MNWYRLQVECPTCKSRMKFYPGAKVWVCCTHRIKESQFNERKEQTYRLWVPAIAAGPVPEKMDLSEEATSDLLRRIIGGARIRPELAAEIIRRNKA